MHQFECAASLRRGFVQQKAAKADTLPGAEVAADEMDAYGAVIAEVRVEGVDSFVLSGAQFGDYYRCTRVSESLLETALPSILI